MANAVRNTEQRTAVQKSREFEFTWEDFDVLRKLSNEYSGIIVSDDKFDMFYSRLSKRLRTLGLSNFREYGALLQTNPDSEFTEFINAITTNLTAFFRENHHFEFLKETLLPEILRRNAASRQVRVWSAGCSTGEEPYSIAMTLLENLPEDWNAKILATDLDTQVLATASQGVYNEDRVSGLSEERLNRWFMKGKGANQSKVRVKPALQKLISFNQLNLMGEWPMVGPFDLIFCRNVIIYFDRETKTELVNRYADILVDGSCLFIGHSESLNQLTDRVKLVGKTIYRKN
ncbi:MAG: protein-glutamate O-methyltransferase [Methylococcales bacterium]